ncbi:MAG TPA: 50S ribosomal protein L4 [Acidobacteriota bacterium]|jgi:large subunit ribosomal protein L4|nr:50S ribosomal protein L4 [Acidobacteriota bacterium]HQO20563.1 50S ribosomal protein L4 [Acidobacteriota bacterium]
MAMLTLPVLNNALSKEREMDLPEDVFGVTFRPDVIHEAVICYLANQRLGTHSTKRRDEVSGSGKKLWKQKHTGRARMGEIRSPLWYHGGITFGPKPRDYSYAIPKKVRRLAIRSIISERIRRGTLKVLDTLEVNEPRTKAFVENYKEIIGSSKTVLFVDEVASKNVLLASRNVPGVDVVSLNELNAYNLAKYETVVFTENTLSKLAEALRP